MDVEGTVPEELRKRGLLDYKVLSIYYANKYVRKIVNLYYDTPEKLAEDHEIQSWAKELVTPKEEGGCGMLGVPGNGHFMDNDQLILALTSIITTCSLAHCAFNFAQYEAYGFPPNYPLIMQGRPPKDKSPKTEEDIIKALPDKCTCLDAMLIVKLLSQKGTKSLGDFEVNFIFDPKAQEIVGSFRADLREISKIIEDRNKTRRLSYPWLNPDQTPNAISI